MYLLFRQCKLRISAVNTLQYMEIVHWLYFEVIFASLQCFVCCFQYFYAFAAIKTYFNNYMFLILFVSIWNGGGLNMLFNILQSIQYNNTLLFIAQKPHLCSYIYRYILLKNLFLDSKMDDAMTNRLKTLVISSNEALELKLVREVADLEDESTTFKAEMSHQVFGDRFVLSTDIHISWQIKYKESIN